MNRLVKVTALLEPEHLWRRSEVRVRPCPVPRAAGVYAWYFLRAPTGVSTTDCHRARDAALLYVGISPKPPPTNGSPPSRQTLCTRVRYHFSGNPQARHSVSRSAVCSLNRSASICGGSAAADGARLLMVSTAYPNGWSATLASAGCLSNSRGRLRSTSLRNYRCRSTYVEMSSIRSTQC